MGKDPDFLKQQVLRVMLQSRRQKAGLTQRQLAEIIGKPQSWVCRHERATPWEEVADAAVAFVLEGLAASDRVRG